MDRVGLIGLGRMGQRLAGRLLAAGLSLNVFDLDAVRCQALAGPRTRPVATPADTVAGAEALITMVTDGRALLAALTGRHGALAAATPGMLTIDMSTIGIEDSRRVAEACAAARVGYVRAPVLGTLPSAEAGQLTALVSGPADLVARAAPLLAHLCSRQHCLGPAEEGRAAKLIVNGLLATTLASFAEGLVLGQKAGLDWTQLLEVVGGSGMASPAIHGATRAIRERNFDPRLTVGLLVKDLQLLSEAGGELGATLPMAGAALPLYQSTSNMGWAGSDTSAIVLLLEALNGLARPPESQGAATNENQRSLGHGHE